VYPLAQIVRAAPDSQRLHTLRDELDHLIAGPNGGSATFSRRVSQRSRRARSMPPALRELGAYGVGGGRALAARAWCGFDPSVGDAASGHERVGEGPHEDPAARY